MIIEVEFLVHLSIFNWSDAMLHHRQQCRPMKNYGNSFCK